MTFPDDVSQFAIELVGLAYGTLTFADGLNLSLTVSGEDDARRALLELRSAGGAQPVPILAGGEPCASVFIRIGVRPDSSGEYMAVTKSAFGVYSTLEKTPLFRLEYRDDMHSAPSCHWQIHAERGALSHLLTLGGHDRPHNLSALHIPVGGARMRPGLEDFLQFLITELGADPRDGWQAVLEGSRERWRRRQIATAVRDVPTEAARVLAGLGYDVTPPTDGHAPERAGTLHKW